MIVDGDVAEVAHEALLRDWPRLARWLDEDRTGRRIHQRLSIATAAWIEADRDTSELYIGTRLDGAADWASNHQQDLSLAEREFLDASRDAAEGQLREAQTRARTEARRSRRLRSAVVAVAVLLVLALVGGELALRSRDAADATALRADGSRLAGLGASEPALEEGVLDAVEGVRLHDSVETRVGLLAAVQRAPRALRAVRAPGVSELHVDATGKHLLVEFGGARGTYGAFWGSRAAVRDADDLETGRSYPSRPATAVLSDGRLATTRNSTDLDAPPFQFHPVIQDPTRGGGAARFGSVAGYPNRLLAQVSSGNLVAAGVDFSARDSMFLASWDLDAPGAPPRARITLTWDTAAFPSVLLAPDGATVYVVLTNHIAVLDARTLAELRTLPGTGSTVDAPRGSNLGALSPDGTHLATLDAAGQVLIRDPATGETQSIIPRQPSTVSALAFEPSGRRLAIGRTDGTIDLWALNVGGRASLDLELTGQRAETMALAFSPTAQDLWSASLDGTIVRWDLTGSRGLYPRLDTASPPTSGPQAVDLSQYRFTLVSPDATRVLYAFPDGLHERDLSTGVVDTIVDYDAPDPNMAVVSPDGRRLYVASNDGYLRRFDIGSRYPTAISDRLDKAIGGEMAVADDGTVVAHGGTALYQFDGETLHQVAPPMAIDLSRGDLALDRVHRVVAFEQARGAARTALALVFVDLRHGRELGRVPIPQAAGIGLSLEFDPTGRTVAVGYPDGRIRSVDRRTMRVTRISNPVVQGQIADLLFTRTSLAAAARDGTIALVDPRTLVRTALLRPVPELSLTDSPFDSPTTSVLASADGRVVVIAVAAAVASFDPGTRRLIRRACALAGPDLPAVHWRQRLPDRTYLPPCR